MITIVIDDENKKKIFTKNVKTKLEKLAEILSDLECFELFAEQQPKAIEIFKRAFGETINNLTDFKIKRLRKYVFLLSFKGFDFYFDTLINRISEKVY